MVNRGRIEIMANILGLCVKPQVKTRIMYNTNITFKQFEIYATVLKSHDLLIHETNRYTATEKGLQFINAFNRLQSTIEDLSTPNNREQRVVVPVIPATFAR